ncbi:MAG: PEP-CTERM sorting domain-containing protein [Armatimonadetes bacterium]|nr:PEP-CTERM sorting domain-containing protein [Armatimonadota bacterium]NIO76806.1 PEP-CTERM sorting domain-containing protein [Armatimonadota bacterium]NIO97011.1 PEP-CTERM sorting domain-containing protein [Armatimonadota bacterium]
MEYALSREIPVYQPLAVPEPVLVSESRRLPLWPLAIIPFLGDGDDDHPPIPEPSTLLLFGAGLPLLARRMLRRTRR